MQCKQNREHGRFLTYQIEHFANPNSIKGYNDITRMRGLIAGRAAAEAEGMTRLMPKLLVAVSAEAASTGVSSDLQFVQ